MIPEVKRQLYRQKVAETSHFLAKHRFAGANVPALFTSCWWCHMSNSSSGGSSVGIRVEQISGWRPEIGVVNAYERWSQVVFSHFFAWKNGKMITAPKSPWPHPTHRPGNGTRLLGKPSLVPVLLTKQPLSQLRSKWSRASAYPLLITAAGFLKSVPKQFRGTGSHWRDSETTVCGSWLYMLHIS